MMPVDPNLLAGYLLACLLLVVTPGPDMAFVLGQTLAGGARRGWAATAGVYTGVGVHIGLAAAGVAALVAANPALFTALRVAGAAYLVWLGVQAIRAAIRGGGADHEAGAAPSLAAAFRQGFVTNLLNPKVGVFYVTFLPQFVPQGANVAAFTFFLVGVHVALTIVWFAGLILATAPLGRFLRRPAVVRTMDRVVGVVFIGFGLKLAASRV